MERSNPMNDAGDRSGPQTERPDDDDPERLQAAKDRRNDELIVAASISVISMFAVVVVLGIVSGCLGLSASGGCGPGTLNRAVFTFFQGGLVVSLVGVVVLLLVRLRRG